MTEPRRTWLFSPVQDLLWGSGVAYLAIFLLLLTSGDQVRSLAPPWLMMFLVVLVSMPHYGATLLRVYEQRAERRKYAVFTVYTTIVLAAFFVWGLSDVWLGSLLFTIYLTWSPWHYTGQNYGIAVMFLGRHGVELSRGQKRALHVYFLLTFVITFFFLHGPYTTTGFRSTQIAFLPLGIPAPATDLILLVASLVFLGVTAAVVVDILRQGGRRSVPALTVMLTQAIWFVLPAWFRNWLPYSGGAAFSAHFASYSFLWIALGHAAQYLWITYYFARRSGRVKTPAAFYVKSLLAGSAIWTVPALLFAPGVLGRVPYDAGLASMIAAIVNLHHFVLDGAIWKLRDGRIAKVLVASPASTRESTAPSAARSTPRRLWPLVAAAGVLGVFIQVTGIVEGEFGLGRGMMRQDMDRTERALNRLAWIGRDSAKNRSALGVRSRARGELERSRAHLQLAVEMAPSSSAYLELGNTLGLLSDWSGAADAYARSAELDASNLEARLLLAWSALQLGDVRRAQEVVQQARLAPTKPTPKTDGLRRAVEERLREAESSAEPAAAGDAESPGGPHEPGRISQGGRSPTRFP